MLSNSKNTQYSLHILHCDAQRRVNGLIIFECKAIFNPLTILVDTQIIKTNINLRRR